jgi:hypothetical protein
MPQTWRLGVSNLAKFGAQASRDSLFANVSKDNKTIACGKHPAEWLAAQNSKDYDAGKENPGRVHPTQVLIV